MNIKAKKEELIRRRNEILNKYDKLAEDINVLSLEFNIFYNEIEEYDDRKQALDAYFAAAGQDMNKFLRLIDAVKYVENPTDKNVVKSIRKKMSNF